ncbi:MAG: hypothetical protein ACMUIL_09865 [bacterium]
MFIENVVRKVFGRHVKTGLLPIRQSETYYQSLESRFFEQGNPFRMLLLNTGLEMKAVAFNNPEGNK